MKPKISVITVVYNNAEGIESTIKSVIGQTHQDLEYIVIDGGSTDGTLVILNKYKENIHTLISEPDKGIYDAMNKGLAVSTGDYVLFMNSADELYTDDVIESIFKKKTVSDIYYGETMLINDKREELGTRSDRTTRKLPENLKPTDFARGMLVSHQSIIVSKKIASDYDLSYSCSADIDWVIKALKKADKIANANQIISKYLVGGHSIQNQKKCWKERLTISVNHFGWMATLIGHAFIVLKGIKHVWILGKRNY